MSTCVSVWDVCGIITFVMWIWRHISFQLPSEQLNDMQSIDSEEGEKIISCLCYCRRSEEDEEHERHQTNIFLSFIGWSDRLVLHRKNSPGPYVCGRNRYLLWKFEKINKDGQKTLVIMTHGDDFLRAAVWYNVRLTFHPTVFIQHLNYQTQTSSKTSTETWKYGFKMNKYEPFATGRLRDLHCFCSQLSGSSKQL